MAKFYNNLNPKTRLWLTRSVIAFLLIILGIPIYKNLTKDHVLAKKEKYQVLDTDPSTFEKTLLTQTKSELDKMRNEIKALKKDIEEANRKNKPDKRSQNPFNSDKNNSDDKNLSEAEKRKKEVAERLLAARQAQEKADRAQIFRPTQASTSKPGNVPEIAEKEKKPVIKTVNFTPMRKEEKQQKISLPPSFMDASLLSGVLAPTGESSEGSTIPMLIRIKDLAVLPNEVKQDLKGCFVIAEGKGKLNMERVETRLVNLSCISKDGKALIDQPVKGWVVDADGRAGLSGRVVAKFGAHIARVAAAGFIEGIGDAMELSVSELDDNFWGGTTKRLKDTDAGTLATAGLGRGIVEAADTMQQFYLDLAKQTLPVIEVGPTKNITIIISEGTDLMIKERKNV
jgi:conjugal transfer pilus assembly protein TraB